jgi:hypothetical protein
VGKGSRPLDLGLRRISFVRVDLSGPCPQAEVVGVAHRRPVTRPVSLQQAADLAAAGVPTVVRHGDAPAPTDPPLVEAR